MRAGAKAPDDDKLLAFLIKQEQSHLALFENLRRCCCGRRNGWNPRSSEQEKNTDVRIRLGPPVGGCGRGAGNGSGKIWI
jgi:hypothetical protein